MTSVVVAVGAFNVTVSCQRHSEVSLTRACRNQRQRRMTTANSQQEQAPLHAQCITVENYRRKKIKTSTLTV